MRRLKSCCIPRPCRDPIAALTFGVRAADRRSAGRTFKGSTLTGWHTVGRRNGGPRTANSSAARRPQTAAGS
jgi:hypothetical protein